MWPFLRDRSGAGTPFQRWRRQLNEALDQKILGVLRQIPRRYLLLFLVPSLLLIVGTVGYTLIEKWSLFDSLYMTVITLTTVGYGEIPTALSTRGRAFTIFLLLGGVFTLFWTATEIIRAVVSGEVGGVLGRQRMERSLAGMRNHLIVCGYGRMGRLVCKEFSIQKIPFVVIDRDPTFVDSFTLPHGVALAGDATSDELLKKAGVERARALVAVASSDADNLYITLSARLLNDRLFIVARADEDPAQQKLLRAGANRVISPYVIGGTRVAQAILRPNVVDFLDLATRTEHFELQIEEVLIRQRSPLAGVTLMNSLMQKKLGIVVVAVKKESGHMVYNPSGEHLMEIGDTLIALGHRDQLDQLEKQASGGPLG